MTTFAHPHDPHAQEQGMTLRDHFAGLAMQAIRAERRVTSAGTIASEAYAIADAMLAERDQAPNRTAELVEALEAMCAEFRGHDLPYGSAAYQKAISLIKF